MINYAHNVFPKIIDSVHCCGKQFRRFVSSSLIVKSNHFDNNEGIGLDPSERFLYRGLFGGSSLFNIAIQFKKNSIHSYSSFNCIENKIGIIQKTHRQPIPEINWNASRKSSYSAHKVNYYDSLGITPKATQGEVKAAYYKLSKTYHPDRNKGNENAVRKFQEVSEAYEVLGNYRLRKKYDKGLLHTEGGIFRDKSDPFDSPEDESDYAAPQSTQERKSYTGRTPIYDFDEWSRAHYGRTFTRRQEARQRYYSKMEYMRASHAESQAQKVLFFISSFVFMLLLFFQFVIIDTDNPQLKKSDRKE